MNILEYPEREVMATVRIEDIIEATDGKVISSGADSFAGVSIDSRKIHEGELFIALRGDRFDGHDFLHEALMKGSGALVSIREIKPVHGKTIIQVKDTLRALQDIARFLRLKKHVPVIAITGSNGKTTTKELIASILGTRYTVLKNTGNLNNHIGLPLSLAGIGEGDEMIVLEMGASAPGEIKQLCDIAVPDCGVLTNISPVHLEGFRDLETIRKTKLELLTNISVAVVNADDRFLMEGIGQAGFQGRLIRYGIENPSEICATDIQLHEKGSQFILHTGGNASIEVNPKISGMFNISNILAAAATGYLFDIDLLHIKRAIDSFTGVPMRLEYKEIDGVKIISDVYNANPASMEAALREFTRMKKGRTIAVLGDMLELGPYEEEAHRKIGRLLSGLSIDIFIAVGPRMAIAASEFSGDVHKIPTSVEAGEVLRSIRERGDTVLIKGSRGMQMEKVLADGS